MGQNMRLHHLLGMELGMVARKRPRLGLKCCKLGVQMGTPEQGTPGQPCAQMATAQETKPRSPEPEPGLRQDGLWRRPGRHWPPDPLFLPAEPQLPRSVVVATLLILALSVTYLQGPFFICNLVPP